MSKLKLTKQQYIFKIGHDYLLRFGTALDVSCSTNLLPQFFTLHNKRKRDKTNRNCKLLCITICWYDTAFST